MKKRGVVSQTTLEGGWKRGVEDCSVSDLRLIRRGAGGDTGKVVESRCNMGCEEGNGRGMMGGRRKASSP